MVSIILLSGTPGTGKTAIAEELANRYGWIRCSLGEIVLEHHFYIEEDRARDTKVIDEDALCSYLDSFLSQQTGTVVVEGHYADIVDHPAIKFAIIFRCHPRTLADRLEKRGYSRAKINENVQAEIVADCTSYMLEKANLAQNHRIFEINTSTTDVGAVAQLVHDIVEHPDQFSQYRAGYLSWMSDSTVQIENFL
jgi:adenylate kinase